MAKTASSFCGLEQDWSTTGAQELPFEVAVVSNETISQELSSSSVVHIGGSVGRQLTLFWTLP
ncbi:MAG: hypothetical protein MUO81_09475 [Thermoplasmata archaeon]|nr:hypothetical protein [Thermoplasmata archaeon]